MPVTKGVMTQGDLTIAIDQAAPSTIRDAVDVNNAAFAHLVVTPAKIDPANTTAAVLFAKSIFTGVVFRNDDGLTLEGHHVTSWLKDPSGYAALIERPSSPLTGTFFNWFDWVVNSTQTAVTFGNVVNLVPGSTLTYDPMYVYPRDVLDYVIAWLRDISLNYTVEWAVSDEVKLNGGTVADLYGTDPAAFLTPLYDGPDTPYPGIRADLRYNDNVEDYLSRESFEYSGGARVGVTNPILWYDKQGVAVARGRSDSDTTFGVTLATAAAKKVLKDHDSVQRQLVATSDRYAVMLDIPVGRYVYAWDQDRGIYDLANKVPWRGTIATPVIARAIEIEMPIENGMGLYLIKNGTAVTDLSDWFVPEAPGAKITLGALERPYQRRNSWH